MDKSEKKEKAMELVILMKSGERFIRLIDLLTESYQLKGLKDLVRKIAADNLDILLGDLVDIYVEHFDDKVLEDVVAFYSTKSGKKYADMSPESEEAMLALGTKWSEGILKAAEEQWLKENEDKKPDWGDYLPPIHTC